MSSLEVPGARLYYETRGSGPLMLIVPGANGEANIFTGVAEHLAAHYTPLSPTIGAAFLGATSMDRRTTLIDSRLTPMMSSV